MTSPRAALSFLFLLVHRQHALGDEKAAEDVDRRHDQGEEAEHRRDARALRASTPTDSSAPTMMTEETAFVTDISGVCSAGVTLQTT